ncbi:MAG: sodium/proton-translocating pyrophosphatase, partial [Panacagrimonas sp.]
MLLENGLIIALACAAAAIVYGGVVAKWIVGMPAGNEKMQSIAAAVQEGAGAYLRRQYTSIAVVGVI